jgi:mRNA interferase MazF
VISRGGVYWVDLGEATGSRLGKRRPVIVVQSDAYTASTLSTVIAVVLTSNTALAAMPGNVFVPATASGLPRDSVINVTGVVTLDKDDLSEQVGELPSYLLAEVNHGLRRVLDL